MRAPSPAQRKAVILGLADGANSILGVVYAAGHHAGAVFLLALSGGLTAAASMAAGEWLSESGSGFGAALAMGAATLAGSLLPALPYALWPGGWAPAISAAAGCCGVAYVVARLRRGRAHPYLETFGALAVVIALSAGCLLILPGGGA